MFGETGYEKIQSRAACIPLQVHIAKDTKAFYDIPIHSFFDDVNHLEEDHKDGLKVAAPADMCSLVRTAGRGGTMKNCSYACSCYNIHRDDIAKPNSQLCDDCIAEGTKISFQQVVSDEALLEHLHVEAQEMLQQQPYLVNSPYKNSRICFGSS